MRIGLNLLYLLPGVVGGTETYAAGLLHGLAQIDKLVGSSAQIIESPPYILGIYTNGLKPR